MATTRPGPPRRPPGLAEPVRRPPRRTPRYRLPRRAGAGRRFPIAAGAEDHGNAGLPGRQPHSDHFDEGSDSAACCGEASGFRPDDATMPLPAGRGRPPHRRGPAIPLIRPGTVSTAMSLGSTGQMAAPATATASARLTTVSRSAGAPARRRSRGPSPRPGPDFPASAGCRRDADGSYFLAGSSRSSASGSGSGYRRHSLCAACSAMGGWFVLRTGHVDGDLYDPRCA
jgi:hypothetical protein